MPFKKGQPGYWTGKTRSDKTRQKISKALAGKKRKPLSAEHKLKISQIQKGHLISAETRRKIALTKLGKTRSEETKRKISIAKKGKSITEEHKRNISEGQKGRAFSKETRHKISEALKGRKKSREVRDQIAKTLNGQRLSEEHKRNISKGQSRYWDSFLSDSHRITMRIKRLNQILPNRNTSIELALQTELSNRGLIFQTHLPVGDICLPDIVFPELRIAIFADGTYWHSKDFNDGKVWKKDQLQNETLGREGWSVLRFPGDMIKGDIAKCADVVEAKIRELEE